MDTMEKSSKSKKATKIDRSKAKYSEAEFRSLSPEEQYALASKYWNGPVADFDDGTFQFSYSHFADICRSLGLRKGIIQSKEAEKKRNASEVKKTIWIEHGKRRETAVKKITLSTETIEMMDRLLGDGLSNIERSKVIDIILTEALRKCLKDKAEGRFQILYRPVDAQRLL